MKIGIGIVAVKTMEDIEQSFVYVYELAVYEWRDVEPAAMPRRCSISGRSSCVT
jgi:hypothetical protein